MADYWGQILEVRGITADELVVLWGKTRVKKCCTTWSFKRSVFAIFSKVAKKAEIITANHHEQYLSKQCC